MRFSGSALEGYLAGVTDLFDRYGAVAPVEDAFVRASPSGARWFEIRADLPGVGAPSSTVRVYEVWRPVDGNRFERSDYEYELLDRVRGFRRAFHLHDRQAFVRRFDVVVHEHCESPIGAATCDHYAGFPVRDAFAGLELLIDAWVDPERPDCDEMACLEPR